MSGLKKTRILSMREKNSEVFFNLRNFGTKRNQLQLYNINPSKPLKKAPGTCDKILW